MHDIENNINELIKSLDKSNLIYTDLISDGYHTFESLYYQRCVLFAFICNQNKNLAWKSKKHSDGTMYDNYFIVGINTPEGQYTYHYDLKYWYYFDVKELENAPEWDGHTENDCFERMFSLLDWKDRFKSKYIEVPCEGSING